MKRSTLKLLMMAALGGCLCFTAVGCSSTSNDNTTTTSSSSEESTDDSTSGEKEASYTSDEVTSIRINVNKQGVEISKSDDDTIKLQTENEKGFTSTVSEEGVLTLNATSSSAGDETIYISLPEKEYEYIIVKGQEGELALSNLSASEITVTTDSGNVNLSNCVAVDMRVVSNDGDVNVALGDIINSLCATATVDSGDINTDIFSSDEVEKSDSADEYYITTGDQEYNLNITTDSGNITFEK